VSSPVLRAPHTVRGSDPQHDHIGQIRRAREASSVPRTRNRTISIPASVVQQIPRHDTGQRQPSQQCRAERARERGMVVWIDGAGGSSRRRRPGRSPPWRPRPQAPSCRCTGVGPRQEARNSRPGPRLTSPGNRTQRRPVGIPCFLVTANRVHRIPRGRAPVPVRNDRDLPLLLRRLASLR